MNRSSPAITATRGIVLALILAVGAQGLLAVAEPGAWQGDVVAMLAIVATLTVSVRLLGFIPYLRDRVLFQAVVPWVVSLLTVCLVMLVNFGYSDQQAQTPSDGFGAQLGGFFTALTSRVASIVDTISPLISEINDQSVPIAASDAFTVSVVLGVGLLYVIFELLIVGLGARWSVLFAVAALWAAPLVLLEDIDFPIVIATLAAVAVLVFTDRIPPVLHLRRIWLTCAAAVAIVAIAVSGTLIVVQDREPENLSLFGIGNSKKSAATGPIVLASEISVGNSLGEQPTQVAYRYEDWTEIPDEDSLPEAKRRKVVSLIADVQRSPMRISSAVSFNGTTWSSDHFTTKIRTLPDSALLRNELSPTLLGVGQITRRVTLENLSGDLVPMSLTSAFVSGIEGAYDASHDELTNANSQVRQYELTMQVADVDAERLRDDSEAMTNTNLDPEYTAVPQTSHSAQIVALAQRITQDAQTPYDQLVALQEFFRDPAEFTYDTELAPIVDDDPVWTFMQTRRGYCVQFATAMAVMARSLGIPTRFSQGFLPGNSSAAGVVEVTGDRAHAWPEFYFPSYGWIRFEPTPASQSTQAPSWTQDNSSDTPDEQNTKTPSTSPTTQTPSSEPTPTTSDEDVTEDDDPDAAVGRTSVMPVVAAVVMVAGIVLWFVIRRRRRHVLPIAQQWRMVVAAGRRVGLNITQSSTPRTIGQALVTILDEDSRRSANAQHRAPTFTQSRQAVDQIVAAVEQLQYGEQSTAPDADQIQQATDVVLAALRQVSQRSDRSA